MAKFQKHQEVMLSIGGLIVGSGTVHKLLAHDMLRGETLGESRVAVMVDASFDSNCNIPYPVKDMKKLHEAMDSVILWDWKDVLDMEQGHPRDLGNEDSFIPNSQSVDMDITKEDFVGGNSQCVPRDAYVPERELHNTFFQATDVQGNDGDEVCLFLLNCEVGRGIVHHVEPTLLCHNVFIGVDNVSVRINVVQDGHKDDRLPFPFSGAETLGEAIGSIVKWAKADLQKVSLVDLDGAKSVSLSSKTQVVDDTINYSQRRNWSLKDVQLYCPDRVLLVGEGVIVAHLPTHSVAEKVLGDENVGVTLIKVYMQEYVPDVPHGDVQMVSWPIRSLKLVEVGRFLGDLVDEEDDDSVQVIEDPPTHSTRGYHSTKRKKVDPEVAKIKSRETKKVSKLEDEEIVKARLTLCCGLQCCHNTSLQDLKELRSDYWGSSFSERKTLILAFFHNRHKEHVKRNLMVLKTREVCKKAFHTIFGFSHSQFYKYQGFFEEGQKVGFHGNQGQLKTRENTMVARALLEKILADTGEPMPHIPYLQSNGTDNIEYRLPSSLEKMDIFREIEIAMKARNLEPIAKSSFYSMWDKNFANFKMHTTSAFSKCDKCIRLKEALQYERRTKERKELEDERALHLQQQMSRRHFYYAARLQADKNPEGMLCIIHDKMDQNKTHLPKLSYHAKSLSGKGEPLPISLTGMITHGRAPGSYAHYGLTGLWPSDPDFTITSIMKCLRDLEHFSGDKSGDLRHHVQDGLHPIFSQLLNQESFEVSYLLPKNITTERFQAFDNEAMACSEASGSSSFKPLPKHLLLQMDNSAKDNKNQTVLAFGSDLVARGIFEKVTMSFLMVGHTHEDIDAQFSKVSFGTRGKSIGTLPELMAEVWDCMQDKHMVPGLITEVAAYKAYLKRHNVKEIVGHSKPISFCFSMRNNKPIYQYKQSINGPWIPENGRCIWTVDSATGKLNVPMGEPYAKNMSHTYSKKDEVVPYIHKYIAHHMEACKDPTSEEYKIKYPLIQYWKKVADILEGEFGPQNNHPQDSEEGLLKLSSRFWPKTNHGTGYNFESRSVDDERTAPNVDLNPEMEDLVQELADDMQERDTIFVGRQNEKERQAWNPLEGISEGSFVVLNPNPDWEAQHGKELFWIVRAHGSVQPDIVDPDTGERKPHFYAEWWRPKHQQASPSDSIRYAAIFSTTRSWEKDPGFSSPNWHKASSSMYSWAFKGKPESIQKHGLKLNNTVLKAIKASIARLREEAASKAT